MKRGEDSSPVSIIIRLDIMLITGIISTRAELAEFDRVYQAACDAFSPSATCSMCEDEGAYDLASGDAIPCVECGLSDPQPS